MSAAILDPEYFRHNEVHVSLKRPQVQRGSIASKVVSPSGSSIALVPALPFAEGHDKVIAWVEKSIKKLARLGSDFSQMGSKDRGDYASMTWALKMLAGLSVYAAAETSEEKISDASIAAGSVPAPLQAPAPASAPAATASAGGTATVLEVHPSVQSYRNRGLVCGQFFDTGECNQGNSCDFEHLGVDDVRRTPDSVCGFYSGERGPKCLKDDCKHFHGTQEQLDTLWRNRQLSYYPTDYMRRVYPSLPDILILAPEGVLAVSSCYKLCWLDSRLPDGRSILYAMTPGGLVPVQI